MSPNKLLLRFTFRSPILLIATVTLGFSGAIFNGISITLIVPLVLSLLGQDTVDSDMMPPLIRQVMSFADMFSGDYRILALTAVVLLAIVLKNSANYASGLISTYFSQYISRNLRLEGVKLLLDIDLDFYSKTKIGDILNRINTEMSRTSTAVRSLIQLIIYAITILLFIAILTSISWELTIISTTILALVAVFNQYFVKRAKNYGEALTKKNRALSNKTIEMLSGIRLVKTVGNEASEFKHLTQLIKEREKSELQSQANYLIISPINETLGIVSLLIIVIFGRYLFLDRLETISAVLLTYLLVLFRLLPVVGQLNGMRSRLANAAPSVAIVSDFLNRDDKPIMESGPLSFEKLKDGIRFESVSFQYPGNDEIALQNINLWISRGETVALVGTSGAGKSTLADLVPRFYDPNQGRLTLDGIDLREFDMKTVRRAMGVVSQDTFLFNNTVFYNLTYGCSWAGEREAIEAAKRANAYEFIMNLPQGFDTEIGDRGVMLSGGQRQRLAIARALIRNPEILILDEATSALDTVSERLVQEAIDELCHDRTTLVIAHRLSTIRKANKIVVMDKGTIVEIGSHDELLERSGQYAKLYRAQFSAESQDAIQRARQETLINTSYEVRTRLNPMIGFLNLLVDDIVDSPEERQELTQEAYDAAVRLLKTLQFLEDSAKSE
ncbi:MAG: ATP-binding cassette domain-containing protein [Cyanobacteria bacterium SBC]|nr:ATP-binding cassette domain-containing protein [Cyanobacteria bacterium SBC]